MHNKWENSQNIARISIDPPATFKYIKSQGIEPAQETR